MNAGHSSQQPTRRHTSDNPDIKRSYRDIWKRKNRKVTISPTHPLFYSGNALFSPGLSDDAPRSGMSSSQVGLVSPNPPNSTTNRTSRDLHAHRVYSPMSNMVDQPDGLATRHSTQNPNAEVHQPSHVHDIPPVPDRDPRRILSRLNTNFSSAVGTISTADPFSAKSWFENDSSSDETDISELQLAESSKGNSSSRATSPEILDKLEQDVENGSSILRSRYFRRYLNIDNSP